MNEEALAHWGAVAPETKMYSYFEILHTVLSCERNDVRVKGKFVLLPATKV
jgi:hypothetical protein